MVIHEEYVVKAIRAMCPSQSVVGRRGFTLGIFCHLFEDLTL